MEKASVCVIFFSEIGLLILPLLPRQITSLKTTQKGLSIPLKQLGSFQPSYEPMNIIYGQWAGHRSNNYEPFAKPCLA